MAWLTYISDDLRHTDSHKKPLEWRTNYTYDGGWTTVKQYRAHDVYTYKWYGVDVNYADEILAELELESNVVEVGWNKGAPGEAIVYMITDTKGSWTNEGS